MTELVMGDDGFVFSPRIIRSPWADYNGQELETCLDAYPDSYLEQVAALGFNGIWLRALLREIAPSSVFPEFGDKHDAQMKPLQQLIARAGRYGLKVYLYLCEPRGFISDDPFWEKHSDVKGQSAVFESTGDDGVYYALCTSTEKVKTYLEEGCYGLFSEAEGLGGLFCITASEHHTHCYSHYPPPGEYDDPNIQRWADEPFDCPRCGSRESVDVVVEVIEAMRRGVRRASSDAQIIAWTWSWYIIEPDPQPNLIGRLSKDVILMSGWERGDVKQVCGKEYPLDEYSFSFVGPSRRFSQQAAIAREHGLKTMAKLQIGATHEIASVPHMPVPHLLGRKMQGLREHRVDAYLACWIFGGDVSIMSELVGRMSRDERQDCDDVIEAMAVEHFGTAAPAVVQAWRHFAEAWGEYPFSIPFLYYGPMNYATAYPLSFDLGERPATPSWRPLPRDGQGHLDLGDNLDVWCEPFGADIVVEALEKLLSRWQEGRHVLAAAQADAEKTPRLQVEQAIVEHIGLSVQSTINVVRFYQAMRQLRAAEDAAAARATIKAIFEQERQTAQRDRDLIAVEPRLGYHAEAFGHLYTDADLQYKVERLKEQLERWDLG